MERVVIIVDGEEVWDGDALLLPNTLHLGGETFRRVEPVTVLPPDAHVTTARQFLRDNFGPATPDLVKKFGRLAANRYRRQTGRRPAVAAINSSGGGRVAVYELPQDNRILMSALRALIGEEDK